jgi:hypothetical protein
MSVVSLTYYRNVILQEEVWIGVEEEKRSMWQE